MSCPVTLRTRGPASVSCMLSPPPWVPSITTRASPRSQHGQHRKDAKHTQRRRPLGDTQRSSRLWESHTERARGGSMTRSLRSRTSALFSALSLIARFEVDRNAEPRLCRLKQLWRRTAVANRDFPTPTNETPPQRTSRQKLTFQPPMHA